MHIGKLLDNGRRKVNQLHKVISSRNINLSKHRLSILSGIKPKVHLRSVDPQKNRCNYLITRSILNFPTPCRSSLYMALRLKS